MRPGLRPGFPESGGDADKWAEVERRLSAIERANRLTSASIGSGGLTIKDGGNLTIAGGQLVAGPTTVDADGVQVGDDVVMDSEGLHVIGGLVTPLWVERYGSNTSNVSLTTGDQVVNQVVVTPPDWVQTVVLLTGHYAQMSQADARQLEVALDIGGGPFSKIVFNTGTGLATNSSGQQSTATSSTFPVTVEQSAQLAADTNNLNFFSLAVFAFGIRN